MKRRKKKQSRIGWTNNGWAIYYGQPEGVLCCVGVGVWNKKHSKEYVKVKVTIEEL